MKNLYLLIIATVMAASCYAQTKGSAKLYGFVQSVAGNRSLDLAEDGTTNETVRTGKNYLLYAVSPLRIYPTEIWIEGIRYGVTVKTISKTPVIFTNEGNIESPGKTLVPSTKEKVIQLVPNSQPTKSVGTAAKTAAKTNALVVVFKQNGTFRYASIKSLTELSGAALQ